MDREPKREQGILEQQLTRRRLLQLGGGVGVAAIAAACGSTATSPSPSVAAAPSSAATAAASSIVPVASAGAAASAAASAAPDFSGVTIRAQVGISEVPILQKIGPDWEALTGGKIITDFTAFPERALKLASIVATQDPTDDIVYAWEGYVGKFGSALYEDIGPLLGDTSDFVPGTLKALSLNGTLYAAPLFTFVEFLMYNKKLYTQAGLDPNSPPTTWAEAYANSGKLTQGKIYPYALNWLGGPFWAYTWYLFWLNSTPTRLVSEDHTQVLFGNSDGLAAFQSILDGYKAGFYDPNALTGQSDLDDNALFRQGLTTQINAGPDVWAAIQSGSASAGVKIAPADLGVAIVPGITAGTSGTINGFEGLGLNKYAKQGKQRDAAVHFIKYMTSPDVQKKMMLNLGADSLPSSRVSVLNDPSIQSQFSIGPILAKQGGFTSARYSTPYDLTPAFDTAIRSMFKGTTTPQQTLDACVKQCQQIIAKYLSS